MSKIKILQENQSYTLLKSHLTLPKTDKNLTKLLEIKEKINNVLPFVNLSNETARREIFVSPILLEIVNFCHCKLRIEYPLKVNDYLKGTLDYLLKSNNNLIVIEAKNDDLTKGFTQLSAELIALAEVENNNILYGAVTMGDIWRFGQLNYQDKQIIQDLNLFKIPDDLEDLCKILIGILESKI